MANEKTNVIDAIGINKEAKFLSLMINDNKKWDKKNKKLLYLQEKINAYLNFVESGEVYKKYPQAKNLDVYIVLSCKHQPNNDGMQFLMSAETTVKESGFYFKWGVVDKK